MSSLRGRKAKTRYEDEEYVLIQFVEDGIRKVCSKNSLRTEEGETLAKYEDGEYYKCITIDQSDNKENLLKKLQMLAGKTSKTKTTGKTATKGKTIESGKGKGKKKESNTCRSQEVEERAKGKERERQILSSRVDGLLEKMTNTTYDCFDDDLIDSCTDIMSEHLMTSPEPNSPDPLQPQTSTALYTNPPRQHSSLAPRQHEASPSATRTTLCISPPPLPLTNATTSPSPRVRQANPPATCTTIRRSPLVNPLQIPTYTPPRTPLASIRQPSTPYSHRLNVGQKCPKRPTTGGKCPRSSVPNPQGAVNVESEEEYDTDEQNVDYSCSSCKKLKLENSNLRIRIKELIENKAQEQPRPGLVNQMVANRFQMVLLTHGSGVYVFPSIIEQASRKKSSSACAAFLLNAFYTNEELLGRNLTGANGKGSIERQIVSSIIDFTLQVHGGTEAAIRSNRRRGLTGASTQLDNLRNVVFHQ